MSDVVDPRISPPELIILATDDGTYLTDRSLLENRGPLFSHVFASSSTKKQTTQILLPEPLPHISEPASVMVDYIDYVRAGGVFVPVLDQNEAKYAPYEDQVDHLIDLYLYTAQIEDKKGMDDVIDALIATYKDGTTTAGVRRAWIPDADTIERVYAATPLAPALRKFFVDVHIWAGVVGAREERGGQRCEMFLRDLKSAVFEQICGSQAGGDLYSTTASYMAMLNKRVEKKEQKKQQDASGATIAKKERKKEMIPREVKCCDYHRHGPGEECVNKKRKRPVEVLDDTCSEDGQSSEAKNVAPLMQVEPKLGSWPSGGS